MAQKRSAAPFVIGGLGLAALVGGIVLLRSKPAAASTTDPNAPPTPTPDPNQPPTPQPTPPGPGPGPTPLPTSVTSAMFPPGGTILVIGDQTAEKLGKGIQAYLNDYAAAAGKPNSFVPTGYPPPLGVGWVATQNGTIDSLAASIAKDGVPTFHQDGTGIAVKPDVIVVATGWAEAKNGVPYQKESISNLAAAFGNGTSNKRHPSVLWALPPSDGDMSDYLGLQVAVNAVATTTLKAPLSNVVFTPSSPTKDEVAAGGLFDTDGPTMALTYTSLDCCSSVRAEPDWSWQVVQQLIKAK